MRPTAARVKEALFSIIDSRFGVSGKRVLDVFAGAGALGLEALSRGAAEAVFVERGRKETLAIARNLRGAGYEGKARVRRGEATACLRKLAKEGERFDLVFIDPPYQSGLAAKVLEVLGAGGLLAQPALVVAEHSLREPLEELYGVLAAWMVRRYGDTCLSFFTTEEGKLRWIGQR
jgi:16S rRNA (guanine(966)-N(2))-methyltransferase RsmD